MKRLDILKKTRAKLKSRHKSYLCITHGIDWDFCPGPDDECVKGEWFD